MGRRAGESAGAATVVYAGATTKKKRTIGRTEAIRNGHDPTDAASLLADEQTTHKSIDDADYPMAFSSLHRSLSISLPFSVCVLTVDATGRHGNERTKLVKTSPAVALLLHLF